MAFQISPGVNVSEVDLTTVVPSVLTTAGAFVGTFNWGPANKIKLIDSEINLVKTFGKPTANSATSFFTAANFLAYGNNLSVVREVGSTSKNATSSSTTILVKNEDIFQQTKLDQNNANTYGPFIARYAGELGNAIDVAVCANTSLFTNWDYNGYFTAAPSTSDYASAAGSTNDEMHIVVIDRTGAITGSADSVIETYGFVSAASDATINGQSNYYKQVLFNQSKYVYAIDPVQYADTHTVWGTPAAPQSNFGVVTSNKMISLHGGVNVNPATGDIQNGYDLFSNKDTTDIALVLTGDNDTTIQNHVISSIVNVRKDAVAFVSPRLADVQNNVGGETDDIATWLTALNITSSYAVADSGWKYQFDKYNNVYRWIPLNGDIAGLCVFTDTIRDPWFSPAGFNRGQIKNCIKLAWNPSKTERDILYAAGVNPVVTFPGQGTVLYGDKTLQSRPSAFDRINVRRLFIVLEKAIASAAKFSLFELNDEFTRAQFVSLVTPFLRDVQGRRGITDFKVVCNSTNNTQQVIDSNQFVGDIYIKPARSANFIQLNFVAVGTGVEFATIVGAA
jgi:hypothetical protein